MLNSLKQACDETGGCLNSVYKHKFERLYGIAHAACEFTREGLYNNNGTFFMNGSAFVFETICQSLISGREHQTITRTGGTYLQGRQ